MKWKTRGKPKKEEQPLFWEAGPSGLHLVTQLSHSQAGGSPACLGHGAASPGKAYLLAGRKGVSSEELLYRVIYIEAVEAGLQEPLGKRGGAVVQPTEGRAFPRSPN